MGRFTDQLRGFGERARRNNDQVCAEVVMAIGTSLVMKSPVGNPDLWKTPPPKGYVGGRFRASWQHGAGNIPAPTDFAPDASGAGPIGRIGAAVSVGAGGKVHFIVSRLPYARKLEYGHSSQAPNGFVAITVTEFQRHVRQAVSRIR